MKRVVTVHLVEFQCVRYAANQEEDAVMKLYTAAREHFQGMWSKVAQFYSIRHDTTKHPLRGYSELVAKHPYADVMLP